MLLKTLEDRRRGSTIQEFSQRNKTLMLANVYMNDNSGLDYTPLARDLIVFTFVCCFIWPWCFLKCDAI